MSHKTGKAISAFFMPRRRPFQIGDTFTFLFNDGYRPNGRKTKVVVFKVDDLIHCRVLDSERVIRFLRGEIDGQFVVDYKPVANINT